MAELGGGKKGPLSQPRSGFSTQNFHGTANIQRVSVKHHRACTHSIQLDTPQQQYQQSSGYGSGRDFSGGSRDNGASGWSNNPAGKTDYSSDTWNVLVDIYNRGPQAAGAYGGASGGGGSGLVTPDQYKAQKTQMNPNDPMQQQMMMMNMVTAYTQPI